MSAEQGGKKAKRRLRTAQEYDRAFLEDVDRHDPGKEAWRAMRIQSEFVNAFDLLGGLGPAVAVFGSARTARGSEVYAQAERVGAMLAAEGRAVVTGGGPGSMEAANKGCLEAGGVSVGLSIQLPFEEGFNPHVKLGVPFHYFFARKVNFVKYTQGAIVLTGGLGTLDELFEVLTLRQTGKVADYPVALVGTQFWEPMREWLRSSLLQAGTISAADVDGLRITDDLDEAVAISTGRA